MLKSEALLRPVMWYIPGISPIKVSLPPYTTNYYKYDNLIPSDRLYLKHFLKSLFYKIIKFLFYFSISGILFKIYKIPTYSQEKKYFLKWQKKMILRDNPQRAFCLKNVLDEFLCV